MNHCHRLAEGPGQAISAKLVGSPPYWFRGFPLRSPCPPSACRSFVYPLHYLNTSAQKKGPPLQEAAPSRQNCLLEGESECGGSSDVGVAAVRRGDGNGVVPSRSSTTPTAAATEPGTHAQEHEHDQGHRPSLSPDTGNEQQEDTACCCSSRGCNTATRQTAARRTLLNISVRRGGGDGERRGARCHLRTERPFPSPTIGEGSIDTDATRGRDVRRACIPARGSEGDGRGSSVSRRRGDGYVGRRGW